MRGRAAGRLAPGARARSRARPQAEARGRGHAPVLAAGAERARPGAAGAARRLGRPHGLEQHLPQGIRRPITHDDIGGNYLHYGVREFGMTAIMNGLALHGGFIPYGGTFLVFSDYARNAVRMAALMKQGVILVYTHDSIGLGEDGPTHQPVEHVASLRLIPNLRALAALRCGGDGGRLGATRSSAATARRAWSSAPGAAAAAAHAPSRSPTSRAAATCSSDCERHARVRADRHGLGSRRWRPTRRKALDGARAQACASSRCPAPASSTRRPQQYRDSVLPPGVPRVAIEAGVPRRLVALRRQRRRGHRHRRLRRLGAGDGAVRALRLHARQRDSDCGRTASVLSDGFLLGDRDMAIKVGINGFGRIGRIVFRAAARDFARTSRSSASTTCSSRTTSPTCSSTTRRTAASRATVAVEGDTLVVNGTARSA